MPLSVREATRTAARARGGSVLEVVPVPSGRETSRAAHLAARLADHETTRDDQDLPVVIPAPTLSSSAADLLTKAGIVARYGATHLAITPGSWTRRQRTRSSAAAAKLGVELVELDIDPAQAQLTDDELDALLTADQRCLAGSQSQQLRTRSDACTALARAPDSRSCSAVCPVRASPRSQRHSR